MGKVKTYWRAELALSTIKLGLQQRENVVEPFSPHQIKITVALDDVKREEKSIPFGIDGHSKQLPQLLLLVPFPYSKLVLYTSPQNKSELHETVRFLLSLGSYWDI